MNKKLFRILDLTTNEEYDAAAKLFHTLLVESSRKIYEDVMDDEAGDEDFGSDAGDESDGSGDEKEDFIDSVAQDNDEVDSEENFDMSGADGEDLEAGEGEGEVEDRVEDLELALADLRAEFDELMSQEMEEPNHDFGDEGDVEGDIDGDVEGDFEGGVEGDFEGDDDEFKQLGEATQFQKEVAKEPLGKEKPGNKNSPLAKSQEKKNFGGQPTKFAKPTGDGKEASNAVRKEKTNHNIDVSSKEKKVEMGKEGKFAGTGKHSSGSSVTAKSPLSKKPQ